MYERLEDQKTMRLQMSRRSLLLSFPVSRSRLRAS